MTIQRTDTGSRNLSVRIAKSDEEIYEAQRLRYKVFAEECGARLISEEESIDRDHFDAYCDHLIVRDTETNEVVGTYRILTSMQSRAAGGFYSQTEFNLSNLSSLCPGLVEVGRSCIHPAYRQGRVISLLWSGLAQYVLARGFDYLMGCASISLSDGGRVARETYYWLSSTRLSPKEWRMMPYQPFPLEGVVEGRHAILPPLIKGYVRLGALICGPPAWDQQFRTADLLMLLSISRMDPRYARHFFGVPVLSHIVAA